MSRSSKDENKLPWKKGRPIPFPEVLEGNRARKINSEAFEKLLPASKRDKKQNLMVPSCEPDSNSLMSILQCIDEETNLDRLVKIEKDLWLAGRKTPPRPLHYQEILKREITITENMDMHLVWGDGRIFIKPMPRFMLEPIFWAENLMPHESSGPDSGNGSRHGVTNITPTNKDDYDKLEEYRKRAWGFLFSYAGLISSESDFRIARDKHLLPNELEDWNLWREIVKPVLMDDNLYDSIHKRFLFGELRRNRLDKIYLFKLWAGKAYVSRWNEYSSFFYDNLGILTSIFVYIGIVLTAMQVGLGTSLKESSAFMSASYGFTIFAILGPLIFLCLVLSAFLFLFVGNWLFTNKDGVTREDEFRRKSK